MLAPSPSLDIIRPIPYGLMSLRDIMKQFPMRLLERLAQLQYAVQRALQLDRANKELQQKEPQNYLLEYLPKPERPKSLTPQSVDNIMGLIRSLCEDFQLQLSLKNFRDLRPATDGELAMVYNWFINELDGNLFLIINPDKKKYWNSRDWIDRRVRDEFPLATQELRAAGTAYACALPTASVFHCMRAAEYGLRALVKERKVKRLPRGPIEWGTWEDLISAVRAQADNLAISFPKGERRDAVRRFYVGALGQFDAFRHEFRNDVMHVRATYEESDASRVISRVPEFMESLSKRTNESGRRIRWKQL